MRTLYESSTRLSLLASLVRGDSDEKSWPLFVEKYAEMLKAWSIRWGASDHESEEVTQETLLTIFQKLQLYRKQEGVFFRSWLKKVAYRCWLAVLKTRERNTRLEDSETLSTETLRRLARPEARDDLLLEFDRMATEEILTFARHIVQERVEPQTWQCFELCVLSHNGSSEVAAELAMSRTAVIKAVSRVRRMLREEVGRLDPPDN